MSNLKEKYNEVKRSVSFDYCMYSNEITHTIRVSITDGYVTGVTVNPLATSYEEDSMFVFDINNQRHLKMAADIHEKVCELLETKPEPKTKARPSRVSKVSGKLV